MLWMSGCDVGLKICVRSSRGSRYQMFSCEPALYRVRQYELRGADHYGYKGVADSSNTPSIT
jgi:hypothetical protein